MGFSFLARSLSSMSSTSSTSTRSSLKNSRKPRLKRSASPNIILAVERSSEKRRRQREQRKAKSSSSTNTKLSNDIEQENDDDDIISIRSNKPKQRQASNSSIEYIQEINHDQSSISSLNNIENLKLKSPSNDQDIILCHSTPSINGMHKIKTHQVGWKVLFSKGKLFGWFRQRIMMNIFEFVVKFVVKFSMDEVDFLNMF